MSVSSDAITRIHQITAELEKAREEVSGSLATPACDGGAKDIERSRLEDLHRRVTGALSALHGEARDY
ncbi:hypothetical protein CLV78_11434 [Aliiruegeria haliotis]|uniref:Uncharacterized protein n=1 Tax=Aliiruegeria haliotis TaxID=1280846 RepID=A0A2T0RGH6_9RHOB|nr:hypothetical protein [Aliiruegeria haliotis]PRY20249.1 hypothetical protein CLV78_11434 [Aliiruegeria haliotis]